MRTTKYCAEGLHFSAFPIIVAVFHHTIVDGSKLVTIDGTQYSIEEPPPEDSPVVVLRLEEILNAVNLEALVKDLTKVGNFIHMASVGVTVARHTELQIRVQKIGFSVTILGSKSHTAIGQFRRACGKILEALQATYEYLLLNMEKTSLRMLNEVATVAKEMATVAQELQYAFEAETKKVIDVLEEAMRVRGLKKENKDKLLRQIKEFDLMKQKAEEARKEAIKAEEKHWQLFEDAKRKQYKALKKSSNPFKNLIDGFTSMKFGFQIFGEGSSKDVAEAAREEKLMHLKYVQEQRNLQQNALQQVVEYVLRIENCKNDAELADVAIDALQAAVGGLKALSVVMMRAADFWERMYRHVDSLKKPIIVEEITAVMNETSEERQKVWKSSGFKRRAIHFYAHWVALHSVCTQYMKQLHQTQDGLYKVLEYNPDEGEAQEELSKLAREFRSDIEREMKAIEDKSSKEREEFQELSELPTAEPKHNDEL